MKKTVLFLLSGLFLFGGAFASEKETGDVYETEEAAATPEKSEKKSKKTKKSDQENKIAEFSVFRYGYFGKKIQQEDADIYYFSDDDEVGIAFDNKKSKILLFPEDARAELKKAFKQYEEEFESKQLINKKRKTSAKYGKIKANYTVGQLLWDVNFQPNITCGYVFVGKSPYFLIEIPETESNIKNTVDNTRTKKSYPEKLLFNRNQMRTFLAHCEGETGSAENAPEAAQEQEQEPETQEQ